MGNTPSVSFVDRSLATAAEKGIIEVLVVFFLSLNIQYLFPHRNLDLSITRYTRIV